MRNEYYRYLSDDSEFEHIREHRSIESQSDRNPYTWYTPTRYDDRSTAIEELALPKDPEHRIGPVTAPKMPPFTKGPRRVRPRFGEPGGGVEVCVTGPVWLFGIWDFSDDDWIGDADD